MKPGPDASNGEIAIPRDAATVLLLRDAPAGFEVFMVKRSGLSDVLGEAHVFPGGKVDAADSSPDMLARIRGLASLDTAALGEDIPQARAAGMFVAAARETFEEAGVLLAHGIGANASFGANTTVGSIDSGAAGAATGMVRAQEIAAARARLNAKEPFAAVLASINAELDAGALVPWVRWVTPTLLSRRFDARFFLARTPTDQIAVHDDYEATHSEWLRPQDAIARWVQDDIKLAPPTYMSLQHLALFDSIDAALDDARGRRPPVIQPYGFEVDGARTLAFPGDARHAVAKAAIPGPLRLRYDGARYVPA